MRDGAVSEGRSKSPAKLFLAAATFNWQDVKSGDGVSGQLNTADVISPRPNGKPFSVEGELVALVCGTVQNIALSLNVSRSMTAHKNFV